jgi:diacyltrehalose acyltransferase
MESQAMAGHRGGKRNRRSRSAKARRRVVGLGGSAGAFLACSACAGLLGMTSLMTAASAFGDDVALITAVGGDDNLGEWPIVVTDLYNLYVDPTQPPLPFSGQPVFPGFTEIPLNTPDANSFFGLGGNLMGQELDMNTAIFTTYAADHIVFVGYSTAATSLTLEMNEIDALPAGHRPDPADLTFVLIGDPNNPDGGIGERLNSLDPNVPYDVATPPDTPYPTDIYTIQYDGIADFPQYPSNILADLNEVAGVFSAHLDYPTLTPEELASAVQLPTSPGYAGDTTYFMIPTQDLPLLDPLRLIPVVGPALADLMQPDLRVLVDLGYDRTGFANVPTPFTLSAPNVDMTALSNELALGANQGMTAAEVDLGILPESDLPNAYPYLPYVPGGPVAAPPALTLPATGLASEPALTLPATAGFPDDSLVPLVSGHDPLSVGSDLTALMAALSGDLGGVWPLIAQLGFDPTWLGSVFSFLG